jgi:NADH-quinone oxidoreductase subunit F
MLRPLLEGMAICGHAIGSDQGYIYCRGEYPFVVELLRKAIDSASAALEVQY